jgi:hypothetical protein
LLSRTIWDPTPDFCYCHSRGLAHVGVQSFLGPSPVGLMTIFYCPRVEAHPSPCIYIPLAKGGPVTSPGTGFPFVAVNVDEKGSQSQSYITTDSHSASLSWCQALIWDPQPNFLLLYLIIFRQLRVGDVGRPL